MKALQEVKSHLTPGHLYRRSDFLAWSNAVDRHLAQLRKEKVLKKLSGGLYYYPKTTAFGEAPPSEHALVESFLKDSRFLMFTPDAYNSLKLGTTQLYNEIIVYNHKRHGLFKLGNRTYRFIRKHHFPEKLSEEFLLVDLVNNRKAKPLAENMEKIMKQVKLKAKTMNNERFKEALNLYGGIHARNLFKFLTA